VIAQQLYRQRYFTSLGTRSVSSLTAKVYEITAERRMPGNIDRAIDHIDRNLPDNWLADVEPTGLGYILVHRGEASDWLLARAWLAGGIIAGTVYRGDGQTFEKAASPIIECVWEAVAAFHERGAWVRAGMSVTGREQYLADILPAGFY
jgi:hypothetical protein